MNRFFNMDSGIFQFLSRLADLMILNVIFLITCIPIVTIGAAWTSLYYMTLKMVRNEESYIVRGYFKAFKENFRQSTIMWLIVLVFGFILYMDFRILGAMEGTSGAGILRVGVSMVCTLAIMVLMYLFPLLSKFYNSIKNTFLNAFLMSIRHLPQTLIMAVITIGAVLLTFFNGYTLVYGILIWIMLGFALVALANSWFLVRIFDKYIPEENEAESNPDSTADDTIQ